MPTRTSTDHPPMPRRSLWWDDAAPLGSDELEETTYDDAVVGAGLTGLVTGLLLARAGRRVVVLEAREVGAGATGNTTGKVSLLQGTKLSRLLDHTSPKVAAAYLEANREGQAWLLRFCDDHGVPVQRRDAVTYAADESAVAKVRREHEAAASLGLPVEWQAECAVPFPNRGGTLLPDQAQFDPMDVLAALVDQVRQHGGQVVEAARVTDLSWVGDPRLTLDDGRTVGARNAVLATGVPIVDRGLSFAKLEANRSYALAFEHPDPPAAMFLSAGGSTRSVRDFPRPDGTRLLLIGGAGHPVGRVASEAAHLDELRDWTSRSFPDAVEIRSWSAQDYASHDGIPQVGRLPRGGGRIYLATGYDKWGMTNGVAAGLSLSAQLLGGSAPWARTLRHRVTRPRSAAKLARMNAATGMAAVRSLASGLAHPAPAEGPAEGEGRVGRAGVMPRATSTASGRTCSFLAVCTHLGGTLKWNDAERTWDCPLHGSRFDATGEVLEGPATKRLFIDPTPEPEPEPQPEPVEHHRR
ncbi:MAG: FAD-dependent oxidoreductase [Marmoricola sp.]